MRERLRRPLLFLITVGTGSLIIIFDAPVEVIVAGTVLAGFLALVITGALDLAELRPSRLRSALRERKDAPKAAATKPPAVAAEKPSRLRGFASKEIDLSGMIGTLAASIRETIAHARAPEGEKRSRIESIDAMLDAAVDGTVPGPATPVPPKAGGSAADPLASLADLDLDSLDALDLDGESSGTGTAFDPDQITLLSGEDADAVSAILRAHQNDLDDLELPSGIEIPGDAGEPAAALPPMAADVPELPGGDGMPDMSALGDDLSALDDLDAGEIEIEGEEPDTEEPEPEDEIAEEAEIAPEEDFDMVSFASGGAADDDLISAIKSDSKKKKFVEDISLVRELRGEKFAARDLAADLEDIVATMKSQ
ncbi:hypothetical protein F8E02_10065 [Methanoculleus sp. Wushi-C6]|uniref:Uncharacterized protein n=1 Tax=Methanoculleus caldifontis TaxID=2651577 RepID=A0ABU3X2P6_9EURY|nr:hypothetical protein [Methanoculleus sp. Wushi-C6]MDV2482338.1 hypothetical protein [Methanoculleus sp. Wushi-C6]